MDLCLVERRLACVAATGCCCEARWSCGGFVSHGVMPGAAAGLGVALTRCIALCGNPDGVNIAATLQQMMQARMASWPALISWHFIKIKQSQVCRGFVYLPAPALAAANKRRRHACANACRGIAVPAWHLLGPCWRRPAACAAACVPGQRCVLSVMRLPGAPLITWHWCSHISSHGARGAAWMAANVLCADSSKHDASDGQAT